MALDNFSFILSFACYFEIFFTFSIVIKQQRTRLRLYIRIYLERGIFSQLKLLLTWKIPVKANSDNFKDRADDRSTAVKIVPHRGSIVFSVGKLKNELYASMIEWKN